MTPKKKEDAIVRSIRRGSMGWKEFLYRLFFDREDSLDTLQILFTAIIIVTLVVTWQVAVGMPSITPAVKIEALITLRWLAGLLVITAIPKWMIPSMVTVLTRGNFSKNEPSLEVPENEDEPVATEHAAIPEDDR